MAETAKQVENILKSGTRVKLAGQEKWAPETFTVASSENHQGLRFYRLYETSGLFLRSSLKLEEEPASTLPPTAAEPSEPKADGFDEWFGASGYVESFRPNALEIWNVGEQSGVRKGMQRALELLPELTSESCQRCEGNGQLYADGKAHYPGENADTMRCGKCGGEGKIIPDAAEAIEEYRAAIQAELAKEQQ